MLPPLRVAIVMCSVFGVGVFVGLLIGFVLAVRAGAGIKE